MNAPAAAAQIGEGAHGGWPDLLTARRAFIATAVVASAFVLTAIAQTIAVNGVVLSETGVVGGDYLAFFTAAKAAATGDAIAMYDQAAFDAALRDTAALDHLGMMWQYPPTFFFVILPLAFLPYKIGYALWMAATLAALAGALRYVGFRGRTLFLLIASPFCLVVLSQGQASYLTAALLILAAGAPGRNALIAGAAAGLLTFKPQLGLLIPLAYVCAGCWRAFAVAAVTAVIFNGAAFVVYGPDGWTAFFNAVARLNADITSTSGATPVDGMTTLYSALLLLSAPAKAAFLAQSVFALAIAALVGLAWRRTSDEGLRAAMLCAGAVLVTPYAYYYEMTVLLIPAAVIVAQNLKQGWRRVDAMVVGGGWLAMLVVPMIPQGFPIQVPFLVSAAVFVLVARQGLGERI